MKILFLVFHGFSDHSGISKKIKGQVKGFQENGATVDLAYYAIDATGQRYWVVDDAPIVSLGKGFFAKIRKRFDFNGLKDYIVEQQYQLVYIRSYHNANPFTTRFVQQIKNSGSKVLVEIPTYPYDQEYQGWQVKPKLWVDCLFRQQLMAAADGVVTFSDDDVIFGQRTIKISNGINFEAIPIRKQEPSNSSDIHLLAVAEIHYWHGFDRALKGLGEYYRSQPTVQVYFHLVGEYFGSRERMEIESVIQSYGLQDYVIVHGALFGADLDHLFDRCDFAIGSLGRHRTGIARMRSLKNREYAARGIPFAYAEEDPDFESRDYVVKYPADESPIDVNKILDFLQSSSIAATEIRESIYYLSWKNQLEIVLSKLFY